MSFNNSDSERERGLFHQDSTIFSIKSKIDDVSISNDYYKYETPKDPDAPYVREEWKNWIKANHQRILSLDSENLEDLHFIDQFLIDKSIVLLGEVAHGIAEQNRIRVRLIKYLHQEHGFNVIAFESSLHDGYFTDKDVQKLDNIDVLKNALYPFWHTTDLVDLVDYMKQLYSSDNPIHLAGFDIHSTGIKNVNRPQFLKNITINIDSIFSENIFKMDRIIIQRRARREFVDNYVVQNYETLRVLYHELINIITNNVDLLKQYFDEETILIVREIAISISKHILSLNVPISYIIRDKQMAETIKCIRGGSFPGAENHKLGSQLSCSGRFRSGGHSSIW